MPLYITYYPLIMTFNVQRNAILKHELLKSPYRGRGCRGQTPPPPPFPHPVPPLGRFAHSLCPLLKYPVLHEIATLYLMHYMHIYQVVEIIGGQTICLPPQYLYGGGGGGGGLPLYQNIKTI